MKASSSFRRSSASRGHTPSGAAFGLMNAAEFPFKTVVLSIVATLALGALSCDGATLPPEQRLARLGLALIIGGAAGNLIDRLGSGHVVDFVDLTGGIGTSGRSTSPTPRSQWASRL